MLWWGGDGSGVVAALGDAIRLWYVSVCYSIMIFSCKGCLAVFTALFSGKMLVYLKKCI